MAAPPSPLAAALDAAAAALRARCTDLPRLGLILGSGLGEVAEQLESPLQIPFAEIPHHPPTSVEGHAGILRFGRLEGVPVAAWRGRAHFYEGRTMAEIGFPIWLLRRLGAEIVVLTNAAGGLNEQFRPGELMLITDHINLPGLGGHSPLRGSEPLSEGPRFVNLTATYDPALRADALGVAERIGLDLHQGVYAMVAGPTYETPAEARFLRLLGADAVGMSTVPEAIVARQAGLRVLAISGITNAICAGEASHEEVLAMSAEIRPRLTDLVRGVLADLAGGLVG